MEEFLAFVQVWAVFLFLPYRDPGTRRMVEMFPEPWAAAIWRLVRELTDLIHTPSDVSRNELADQVMQHANCATHTTGCMPCISRPQHVAASLCHSFDQGDIVVVKFLL